jgi:hypothetical protein
MKLKHLYSLLDDSYTTIKVSFSVSDNSPDTEHYVAPTNHSSQRATYTYKIAKSVGIKVHDRCVVMVPGGLKIVRVVKVDETPDIDIDAGHDYKWVVQKIDLEAYQAQIDKEKMFADTMLQVERAKQRESLITDFKNGLPAGSQALKLFEQATQTLVHEPAVTT